MIILIHSSKTMCQPDPAVSGPATGTPALLDQARDLVAYLRTLPPAGLAKAMSLSEPLARRTRQMYADWSDDPAYQGPAVASFLGDIYSGLRAAGFTAADREYADARLRILSGLYGILRPYDGIMPYRLEMGYRLPDPRYANLYRFFGGAVAGQLPPDGPVVNLAAAEYSRVVTGGLSADRVVTPRFLTVDPGSGEPKFVTVHAKIARGAYARWLITERIDGAGEALTGFTDLGYRYQPARSTPAQPCFVCVEFAGKGLSVRLTARRT